MALCDSRFRVSEKHHFTEYSSAFAQILILIYIHVAWPCKTTVRISAWQAPALRPAYGCAPTRPCRAIFTSLLACPMIEACLAWRPPVGLLAAGTGWLASFRTLQQFFQLASDPLKVPRALYEKHIKIESYH